jgi:hypothetical protein
MKWTQQKGFKVDSKQPKVGNEAKLIELSKSTGLDYDGSQDSLFYDHHLIGVFASDMTETDYVNMERQIKGFSIKRKNYEVIPCTDFNGYAYWKNASESDRANHIHIQVKFNDLSRVNTKQLMADVLECFELFEFYDNRKIHVFSKS